MSEGPTPQATMAKRLHALANKHDFLIPATASMIRNQAEKVQSSFEEFLNAAEHDVEFHVLKKFREVYHAEITAGETLYEKYS